MVQNLPKQRCEHACEFTNFHHILGTVIGSQLVSKIFTPNPPQPSRMLDDLEALHAIAHIFSSLVLGWSGMPDVSDGKSNQITASSDDF